jgi:hypothetical protein
MEKSVPGTPNVRNQENSSIKRGSNSIPVMPTIRRATDVIGNNRIQEHV